MSDTLTNALAQAGRSSSVLQSISNPAVLNPLAGMGSAISTVQGMQGLQEKAAQQAAGQAYQGAIDQQTGEFDPNKFRTLLARSGPAAMAAGAALLNTQQISSNQLDQNLKKAGWVNSVAGALLQKGDFSDASMLGALHNGVAGGILTLPEAQRTLATMPPDAAGRQRWLQEHQDTAATFAEQMGQRFGTAGTETDPSGRRIGTVQQSPRAGGALSAVPQAGVPLGLGPEGQAALQKWLVEPVDVPDLNRTLPDGSPNPNYMRTKPMARGDYLKAQGIDPATLFPGGGSPAAPGTSPLGTGRPPATLLNPNKPQPTQPAAPATPAQPAVPVGAQPSPGEKKLAEDAPVRFQAESDADTKAQNQQAILGNMLSDTSQFVTGPQAGIVGKIRNWAIGLGIPGANVDAQAAKESFGKFAAQLADAQGAGSDARMSVNISANPHEELSAPGVDLVLRQLQGNADYLRARAALAAKWQSPSDYRGFQTSIKELDPRIYQLARMKDDQRRTYWNSLDSQTQKQLNAAGQKYLGGG